MILLNGKKVDVITFPNGESCIHDFNLITKPKILNEIVLKFESDADLIHLMFLKKHLDEMGISSGLLVKYLPYSRMDRTEGANVFTLKYFCKFIKDLNFETVVIYEPHSDVCVALLNKVTVVNKSERLTDKLMLDIGFSSEGEDYLVYPDAGAEKRYSKQIGWDKVLTANKKRDFVTGRIKELTIGGTLPKKPFRAIIVDDLCSKGGTFMLCAKKLKELGATDIYLVVAHCEDTIFKGDILTTDLIKGVYTTDSILSKEHEKIRVFD